MKAFVLLRGKSTEMLFLYNRETYEYMMKHGNPVLEFVIDHDDPEVLKQMQKLVNKDIEIKD